MGFSTIYSSFPPSGPLPSPHKPTFVPAAKKSPSRKGNPPFRLPVPALSLSLNPGFPLPVPALPFSLSPDEAALCTTCDHRVRHANKLAGKHPRFTLLSPTPKDSPICDICQERRGLVFCRQDRAILCKDCDLKIHKITLLLTVKNQLMAINQLLQLSILPRLRLLQLTTLVETVINLLMDPDTVQTQAAYPST